MEQIPSHKNTSRKTAFGQAGSMAAQIYRQLREAIIRGDLAPGQALSEAEIARQFATSRQPVREALIKLSEAKLIMILPQRGTYIAKISVEDVLDARFVREAIEVAIAREAALTAPTDLIDQLRRVIAQQTIAAQQNDCETFLRLDEEFHRIIILSSGNQHAWRVTESIKAQMDRLRYLGLDDSRSRSLLIEQHTRITDALEARNPVAAAAAVRTHLREIILSLPDIAARFPERIENSGENPSHPEVAERDR